MRAANRGTTRTGAWLALLGIAGRACSLPAAAASRRGASASTRSRSPRWSC